jgi:hypothetical protein
MRPRRPLRCAPVAGRAPGSGRASQPRPRFNTVRGRRVRNARAVVKDEAHAAEEENQELWTADWDDEEVGEDFQQRLQRELGRHAMKE